MKKLLITTLCAAIFLLNSCKMADVILPSNANPTAYEVSGKRSLRLKTKIEFGDYEAVETKISFSNQSKSNFSLVGFSLYEKHKANQRFQFRLRNTQKNTAYDVMAIHSVNQSNIDQIRDMYQVIKEMGKDSMVLEEAALNGKDYLLGAVKPIESDKLWKFGISNASASSMRSASGYLNYENRMISIKEVEEVTEGWLPGEDPINMVYGFTFEENEQHLATVRVYQGGKIWIEKGIESELEDVVATLSAALIIKKTK